MVEATKCEGKFISYLLNHVDSIRSRRKGNLPPIATAVLNTGIAVIMM